MPVNAGADNSLHRRRGKSGLFRSERDDGEDNKDPADGGGQTKPGAGVLFPEMRRTFPIVLHTQLPSYSRPVELYGVA